ncbi:uncharacterized protein KNAG_0M01330 [Huiozyma naganishii CBS 8797]|uniref:DUF3533 domain-containing protein n=1 Tax=Huiozyma naganishii (strain ATCC MYA-139 / BCRC 22969 / CBS 8797 / KCTC 17520 / NBRC 10181 / NCYC 3082 / Yp74L-3) TaxID=1071383 RepID=J7SBE7_HUIN7|nr:hypothetical protein KNAG_0M01330 [Kazachstania naganishii CBS 8797]CCK72986.1 hypothetical protein KNAG_0M01330 [Kazachstania naganishii CBS 8797]
MGSDGNEGERTRKERKRAKKERKEKQRKEREERIFNKYAIMDPSEVMAQQVRKQNIASLPEKAAKRMRRVGHRISGEVSRKKNQKGKKSDDGEDAGEAQPFASVPESAYPGSGGNPKNKLRNDSDLEGASDGEMAGFVEARDDLYDYYSDSSEFDSEDEPEKTHFFSSSLSVERRKVFMKFLLSNLLIGAFCISVLSIYWGGMYRYQHYMGRVKAIAVIQEDPSVQVAGNFTMHSVAWDLPDFIAKSNATWKVYNSTEFKIIYNVTNQDEINAKIVELVYDEKIWMALNIKENATAALYNSYMVEGAPAFNSTKYYQAVYMSGRDPANFNAQMLPQLQIVEKLYRNYFTMDYLPRFLDNMTNVLDLNSINSTNLAASGKMFFDYYDFRPFYNRMLLNPLQTGLIYCVLLTVFQISMFGSLHAKMAKLLTVRHMIIYRFLISWTTYFVLSLFFCTVSAIFQIDFTYSFGSPGFVIYWMTTWLFMIAIGGCNENVISLLAPYYPSLISYWMNTWNIINVAAAFYPFALNDVFYRYGYAMPLHNAMDIFRVIFLDLSRHKLGRNYGILAAWVGVNSALFPFVIRAAGRMAQKKQAEMDKERDKERRIRLRVIRKH